ncbi:MAG: cobalamin-dependent protein [Candidatus Omnitrophica bacterium]|nr:cobalamin-dependent protein [Candidatus Omnitrophota bacterium]
MKILFISPPWGDVYSNYKSAAKIGNAYPPLGLCYLSAVLEGEGHITKIIDAEVENKSIFDIANEVKQFQPHAIGMSVTSPLFHIVRTLAAELKKLFPSIIVFIGGPHCSAVREQTLSESKYIDYCLYGEGERNILEFINLIKGKKKLEDVRGLIYRGAGGKIRINTPSDLIDDLDSIPFPLRNKLQLEKYKWSVPGKGIVKFTTIMTSRGCPFSCVFCSTHTVFGKRIRNRSVSNILNELQLLTEKEGIKHFAFIDDTFTLNHERMRELCAGIKDYGFDITWEGWTRANTINYDILKTMRDAGFIRISFGIESANETVARIIRKEVPLEAYPEAYRIAKELKIETRGSVILGNPGETQKSALETLNFARNLKDCDQIYINIATPYPATELYKIAKSGRYGMKLLTDNLSKYKRYGNAVIEVNDLKREDLVKFQRKGFMMFYFTPARIWYNFKRAGLIAFVKNALAFVWSLIPTRRK